MISLDLLIKRYIVGNGDMMVRSKSVWFCICERKVLDRVIYVRCVS